MIRERALKVVLVLVGLLFLAAIYPVVMSARSAGIRKPPRGVIVCLPARLHVTPLPGAFCG